MAMAYLYGTGGKLVPMPDGYYQLPFSDSVFTLFGDLWWNSKSANWEEVNESASTFTCFAVIRKICDAEPRQKAELRMLNQTVLMPPGNWRQLDDDEITRPGDLRWNRASEKWHDAPSNRKVFLDFAIIRLCNQVTIE